MQQKKYRDAEEVFVAEGTLVLYEMIAEGNFSLVSVYATEKWIREMPTGLEELVKSKLEEIEFYELEKISSRTSPVGALAVFKQKEKDLPIQITGSTVLVLDGLQDPGNLGTIIRTADWFGIKHIICSEETADCHNPKVVQSTMASLGRVAVHYTEIYPWLQDAAAEKYAATLDGEDLNKIHFPAEAIIIIGNEGRGISEKILSLPCRKISVPGKGKAESLNAAVAAGIIMHKFLT